LFSETGVNIDAINATDKILPLEVGVCECFFKLVGEQLKKMFEKSAFADL